MLIQLQIENIALINKISLEIGSGMNILTGETGAGKSILIDSINAVLGSRVSRDMIRSGSDKASVEAVLMIDSSLDSLLNEYGVEPEVDNTLILSRQMHANGKNICRINGTLVTVSILKEIGQHLIDIHGQHDNQSLLRTETHIELLDMFSGDSLLSIKKEYVKKLKEYHELHKKLDALIGNDKDRERIIDILKYQIQEITEADLKPEEDEKLERQYKLLSNTEKIIRSLSNAYDSLNNDEMMMSCAVDMVNKAAAELEDISDLDKAYTEMAENIGEVELRLEDISSEIRRMRDRVEYNPDLLSEVENRLDTINSLKKKYGETIEDIITFSKRSILKLEELENSKELVEKYKESLLVIKEDLYKLALEMNKMRNKASKILDERITTQLEELEMKKASFEASINFNKDGEYTFNGLDTVEFLISPNVGEPLKPLSKIASGGEMSRIMLAIKTILAEIDRVPTLIFDEIDTGVSGKAAQRVGEKLNRISKSHQVICITHLAQIACLADNHYLIEKHTDDNKTATEVIQLKGDDKVDELARLISGENDSKTTKTLAKEMLEKAKRLKQL